MPIYCVNVFCYYLLKYYVPPSVPLIIRYFLLQLCKEELEEQCTTEHDKQCSTVLRYTVPVLGNYTVALDKFHEELHTWLVGEQCTVHRYSRCDCVQTTTKRRHFHTKFFVVYILASGGSSLLYPEILQYYTMILQRPWIIMGDAGFEPGTPARSLARC